MESVQAAPTVERRSRRAALLLRLLERAGVPCEVVLPDGERLVAGGPGATPRFRAVVRSPRAFARGLDEFALGRAYVEGDLDLEGDLEAVFALRGRLAERSPLAARLRFLGQLLAAPTRMNRRAIDHHYTLGDDFYLGFIDSRYRFYSHGLFHDDAETLEQASEHKLERMWDALELRPGMRLLDIGGGWGGVTQYCGARGVHVTSLTIARDSQRYIERLIAERGLPGEVRLEDFLEHRPARPYDAVVIYGVIEHLPNYRRFCARAWECLPPGGRLYLDASASKEKFRMSAFTRHYIWHGTHTFLALQDLVQELLWHGFELLEVRNESRDYERTMRGWATRFDAARERIVERWGERVYRAFRVYLWGGCHAFQVDRLQAYSLVVRRGAEAGPRPGLRQRAQAFAVGLRG